MKTKLYLTTILIIFGIQFSYSQSNNTSDLAKSPEEIGKLVTNDLLSRSDFMMYRTPTVNAVHYAEACTAYGAIKLAGFSGEKQLLDQLAERYDRVIDEKIPNTANHVDVNVYGILPLELYMQTNKQKYFDQGIELADGQWEETTPDGLTSQTRFWIDDIYMIGCLQTQAYRATGNLEYLEKAALEIDTYIDKLQQPNGLFYHGLEAPFFWGRGNGWVAAGMAELLSELPKSNPHYKSILKGYKKMMKTLAKYQGDDGMWHQLIDHPESFKETSSTGMFGFAMTVGVKKGLLPKKPYSEASKKAWNALTTYINEDGKIREVCVGTGQSQDTNFYLTRPRVTGDLHGQAPILWFAYSLLADYK
jgi:unsaturated rhamnogalacturonyl hydrolase